MEFKEEIQANVHDMYMIINNQSINDDFISTLKWEHLEEFIEDIHMIKNMTIMKVEVDSSQGYNTLLINYLRNMGEGNVKDYFSFKKKSFITDSDYDNDSALVDCIFNIVTSGYEFDINTSVITLTDNLQFTDDIKHLIDNYGFSLKINK